MEPVKSNVSVPDIVIFEIYLTDTVPPPLHSALRIQVYHLPE